MCILIFISLIIGYIIGYITAYFTYDTEGFMNNIDE